MAAAGLDSIGAIVGYAVCSGISITSGSLVYSILSGPLQVLLLLLLSDVFHHLTSSSSACCLVQICALRLCLLSFPKLSSSPSKGMTVHSNACDAP